MDFSNNIESSRQYGAGKEEDVEFKILIFTDNHVGFKETHPIRGEVRISDFRTPSKLWKKFYRLVKMRELTLHSKVEIFTMTYTQHTSVSAKHCGYLRSSCLAKRNTHSNTTALKETIQEN